MRSNGPQHKFEEEHGDFQYTDLSSNRYDFVGDIRWMVQICAPSSNPDTDFPIDISQHRPCIHVAAVASNPDKAVRSFDLDGQQYISILTHEGFLVNATFSNSKDLKILQRFHIEVDSVIALGYHQQGASAGTEGVPSTTARPGCHLMSYSHVPSVSSPMPSAPDDSTSNSMVTSVASTSASSPVAGPSSPTVTTSLSAPKTPTTELIPVTPAISESTSSLLTSMSTNDSRSPPDTGASEGGTISVSSSSIAQSSTTIPRKHTRAQTHQTEA
ncbi:hypothetical protein BJ912DRAFT_943793 [Pholiota molesta]|nr:hypothetical protein BJ912DRAFT_943793 [Pholiota molesta]